MQLNRLSFIGGHPGESGIHATLQSRVYQPKTVFFFQFNLEK